MIKKFFILISALLIIIFLVSCNSSSETEKTAASDLHIHEYGEWRIISEPDCTAPGKRQHECTCGNIEEQEISPLGHTGGDATCSILAKCTRCGERYGDYDKTRHSWFIPATCIQKERCFACGFERGDVDPSNHKMVGTGIDVECELCHTTLLPKTDDGITDSKNEKPIYYYEYLEKVNLERRELFSSPYTGKTPAFDRSNRSKRLTKEEISKLTSASPRDIESSLTKEQALEDIDLIFRSFYTLYSPYEFFGEELFDNAEKKAKKEVNEFFSSGEKEIYGLDFYNIIKNSLDFIVDSHACIGYLDKSYSFTDINKKRYYSYYLKDIVFREDDKGYYTLANGNKWYLDNVNGGDFKEYLKVTIDKNGELVYALVRIANPEKENMSDDTLTLKRGSAEYVCNIEWTKYDNYKNASYKSIAGVRIENGVPVIHARSFMGQYKSILTKYSKSGKELREQFLFIVDIRANNGGYSIYNSDWIYNYINSYVHIPRFYGVLDSSGKVVLTITNFPAKLADNKNNIILLVDNNVGSSGELAYSDFASINNTLIVGTNTIGCSLAGDCVEICLPNSGIYFSLGRNFFYFYKNQYKGMGPEGIGFFPNVYVNGTEALELTMKMIDFYNIEKSNDTSGITCFGN